MTKNNKKKGKSMAENIIIIALILLCASRSVGYALYTIRQKNITGGIGVLLLPIGATVSSLVLMFK